LEKWLVLMRILAQVGQMWLIFIHIPITPNPTQNDPHMDQMILSKPSIIIICRHIGTWLNCFYKKLPHQKIGTHFDLRSNSTHGQSNWNHQSQTSTQHCQYWLRLFKLNNKPLSYIAMVTVCHICAQEAKELNPPWTTSRPTMCSIRHDLCWPFVTVANHTIAAPT
jgi:hypothetical protein